MFLKFVNPVEKFFYSYEVLEFVKLFPKLQNFQIVTGMGDPPSYSNKSLEDGYTNTKR
jgi:hypothetical protein